MRFIKASPNHGWLGNNITVFSLLFGWVRKDPMVAGRGNAVTSYFQVDSGMIFTICSRVKASTWTDPPIYNTVLYYQSTLLTTFEPINTTNLPDPSPKAFYILPAPLQYFQTTSIILHCLDRFYNYGRYRTLVFISLPSPLSKNHPTLYNGDHHYS